MSIQRADLTRPGVRVLNLGGWVNPDVLLVYDAAGVPVVVKDYARRHAWVRRWLARWLVDRELALLRKVAGAPGVPRALVRIDDHALALEWIDGQPLRRRSHAHVLPTSFFAALESTLEALHARGVFYADLRSPTNVLCTRRLAPALIDLASAVQMRLPRRWVFAFYRRALSKLRARFEASDHGSDVDPFAPAARDLQLGSDRARVLDIGIDPDPVPVVFLPDPAHDVEQLRELMQRGGEWRRRSLGLELAELGGSRASSVHESVDPAQHAQWLGHALSELRIERCDLVAFGWSGLVGRSIGERQPDRIRKLVTIDTPVDALPTRFVRIRQASDVTLDAFRAALYTEPRQQTVAGDERRLARLRRAYRALEIAADANGRLRLAAAPWPKVPWLALFSDEEPAQPQDARASQASSPRAAWPSDRWCAELWSQLTPA